LARASPFVRLLHMPDIGSVCILDPRVGE
jgi:hypothetical protein